MEEGEKVGREEKGGGRNERLDAMRRSMKNVSSADGDVCIDDLSMVFNASAQSAQTA